MLTVFEIYPSIQGESTHAGRPCVFVRLAACDLRCSWCDTPYAFTGGQKMAVEDVLARVAALGCPLVELTGGEPLLQKEAIPLMAAAARRRARGAPRDRRPHQRRRRAGARSCASST